jgi:hypothetical protein
MILLDQLTLSEYSVSSSSSSSLLVISRYLPADEVGDGTTLMSAEDVDKSCAEYDSDPKEETRELRLAESRFLKPIKPFFSFRDS